MSEREIRCQAFAVEKRGGRRKNAVGQRAQKWEGHLYAAQGRAGKVW